MLGKVTIKEVNSVPSGSIINEIRTFYVTELNDGTHGAVSNWSESAQTTGSTTGVFLRSPNVGIKNKHTYNYWEMWTDTGTGNSYLISHSFHEDVVETPTSSFDTFDLAGNVNNDSTDISRWATYYTRIRLTNSNNLLLVDYGGLGNLISIENANGLHFLFVSQFSPPDTILMLTVNSCDFNHYYCAYAVENQIYRDNDLYVWKYVAGYGIDGSYINQPKALTRNTTSYPLMPIYWMEAHNDGYGLYEIPYVHSTFETSWKNRFVFNLQDYFIVFYKSNYTSAVIQYHYDLTAV